MARTSLDDHIVLRLRRQDRIMRAVGAVAWAVAASMFLGRLWRHAVAFRWFAHSPTVAAVVDRLSGGDPSRHWRILAMLSDLAIFPVALVAGVFLFRGLAWFGRQLGIISARRRHAARSAMFRRMAAGQPLAVKRRPNRVWRALRVVVAKAVAFLVSKVRARFDRH